MQVIQFDITTTNGYKTPMYGWLPDGEPACIMHIVHGMAEHAGRYSCIAALLVKQGIAVYAHNNRAHGKAAQTVAAQGIGEEDWFNKQVEDLHFIIHHLKSKHPFKKIFLLGHSMGSFLCQRYFQLYGKEIDALILSATNGQADPLLNAGIAIAWAQYKFFGKKYRSTLINTLSFGRFNKPFQPARTRYDWLSKDQQEVDKYISDPQCGYVCSAGFFYYFFKGIRDAFKKENIALIPKHIPVYCFAGDKDPVGLQGKGFMQLIKNWKAAGIKNISYILYKDGRHEMLNEINRQEVVDYLIKWMLKNL